MAAGETPEPHLGRATTYDGPASEGLDLTGTRPATRAELFGLFEHLEAELDASGFLRPPEKRPTMIRAIRNMFHRMGATEQDVRTWRGIVASLAVATKDTQGGGAIVPPRFCYCDGPRGCLASGHRRERGNQCELRGLTGAARP